MSSEVMRFQYRFSFRDGSKKEFSFALDKNDLSLRSTGGENPLPEWTRLEFHQCSNCTLKEEEHPCCPVAKEYYAILLFFTDKISTEKVKVAVKIEDRSHYKETDLQTGISTMAGVINVTCGCPVLSQLRPMVLLHVPFASSEETTIRMLSLFLMKKFFEHKNKNAAPSLGLNGKMEFLKEVEKVNIGLVNRIRSMSSEDANVNALLRLDAFVKIMKDCIETEFEELDPLFNL
ncbi:hypothetical protein UR09_04795 [Candidatus Nitromaritima sp. SCGC AAA799-A02]|nr:hypothetical protein UR09_04795 [Candidatus Nitromaritima sp. SCGC AAA799-A02]